MYEYLKGIITKITAKYIVLEANGIGYILHVANPYAYSGQVNQEAQIYVHQVVRGRVLKDFLVLLCRSSN